MLPEWPGRRGLLMNAVHYKLFVVATADRILAEYWRRFESSCWRDPCQREVLIGEQHDLSILKSLFGNVVASATSVLFAEVAP